MLDFRIETFLTVCRYMNYTKAAKALNITQPGVSQHIRALENHYGIALFTYQNRKLTLTKEGETFKTAITTMMLDEQRLREHFRQEQAGESSLAIGFTLTVGEYAIPQTLAAYLAAHPQLNAEVTISNTHDLLSKINSGDLDVALVEGYFDKTEYDYRTYSTEPYIAVASGHRADAMTKSYRLEDILKERLICREQGSGTLEILEKCLIERNLSLRNFAHTIRVTNLNVIKELVANDCGITFLYQKAVERELANKSLIKIPIKDFHISHDFTFIWRKGSVFASRYEELFQNLKKK